LAVTSSKTDSLPATARAVVQGEAANASFLQLGAPGGKTEVRRKALADSLINTRFFPPFFTTVRMLALEAQAYHQLRPYPYWQFSDWKTEERGVLPRCLPLARRIVNKSAKWLFGKPVEISMPGNETAEKFLKEAWQLNRMPSRMVAGAERAGVEGGLVLKWSYDEEADIPLRFQVLSVINECRLFYDPHDRDCLLMARIQYPVFNPQDGEYYLYREEWTDDWEVHYRPQKMTTTNLHRVTQLGASGPFAIGQVPVIQGTKVEPDLYDKWEIASKSANPFKIIPVHHVRNSDALATFGKGDLWTDATGGMFRLMDRINLTYQGMDRNNQLYADPVIIFVDAKAGSDVLDRSIQPGQGVSIKSEEGFSAQAAKQAQVHHIEPDGAMRPHIRDYALDLKKEILSTVGSVDVDTSEVGNKGNLTEAVLVQLYAPLIETTEEKRKTFGEDGIAKFLERVAVGLSNLGAEKFKVDPKNRESYDVKLRWPEFFPLDDEGKTARFTRVMQEADAGYLPPERAIEVVLQMEGVEDVPVAKKELEAAMERQERMREATVSQAEADVEATKNPPQAAGSSKQSIGAGWRSKSAK
jgi:hypothetical protein